MFLIHKNRKEKCYAHLLDPIWMSICLAKKTNVKKSIDKSRGVHIWKCERLIVLGVNEVAVGWFGLRLGPNEAHGVQGGF